MSLKDLRDEAAGKVITTAAGLASDPVGTARGIAKDGVRTALKLPVRAGLAATGPALSVVSRGLAIAGSALRTGRQVRHRLTPWQSGNDDTGSPNGAPSSNGNGAAASLKPADTAVPTAGVATPDVAVTEPEPEIPEAAIAVGAPGTADAAVARAERAVGNSVPDGATLSHDELPVADYDHLTLPALRARLTRIDLSGLVQLRDYEKAHANRLPVVTMLENRIAKVTASNGS
jgi:hypothetical protein